MTTLRVMTANLCGSRVDLTGLAALVERVAPDVLAVQELEHRAAAVIAAHFPHHGLDPQTDALGSGIAVRYPAALDRVPMAHRAGWSCRFTPSGWGCEIEVVALHLFNPVSWPWWRSVAIRGRQVTAAVAHLGAGFAPAIVVGDMNATPLWPAYRRLSKVPGLVDAVREIGAEGGTWRWHGLGPPTLRIDHCMVRSLHPIAATTAAVPGSDHLALVVDIAAESSGSGSEG